MTTIRQAYANARTGMMAEPKEIPGTHPSPLVFPVGTDSSGEQVCWNTKQDPHLFLFGSVVDGIDTVLHHLTKQATNHENHWSLYSANSFGAGKHAHGLTETAWHKSVNLNLYITMIEELAKVYNDRRKQMADYRLKSFGELRRIKGTNELLIIMPDLTDIIADDRSAVQSIVDIASLIAVHGPEVGMHGVFVFDRMGEHSLYSDVLGNASAVILRNVPENELFGTSLVTEIPFEKGHGLLKTQDNVQKAFFQTL